MNEQLRVDIVVDASGAEAGAARARRALNSVSGATNSVRSSTAGVSQSFGEMRQSIEQIRNLQFADLIDRQLDRIHGSLLLANESLTNLFSRRYWRGASENIHSFSDLISTIGTEGREAWRSFRAAGSAALQAIHIKLVALVASIAALGAAIKNAFRTAGEIKALNNEAAKVGLSVNTFQDWAYIMEKTGSDAGVLADAIKTLSAEQMEVRKGTEDSIKRFEALGLSMQEVANMSQEQLFKETIRRLQQVRNEVDRTALAYQIFGEEDAAQLANVLRLTNAETASLAATNRALGATISQDLLTKSLALSSAVSTLKTAWQGLTNTLGQLFMPVLTTIVNGLTKAMIVVNTFLKTVFGLDMTPAMSNISAATGTANLGLENLENSAESATGAIQKLKKATMGFDELNIVANPKTASSGAGGGIGGIDLGGAGGFTETDSALDKIKGKWEQFAEKVQAFMDKWKPQIQAITGLLGALGVAGLIASLGKALGLGETFFTLMKNLKGFLATAIIATIQFTVQSELAEAFLDGEGWKNYIYFLVAGAIGAVASAIAWGPTGLVVSLGVTAAVALGTVFEKGGITDLESATLALTGLAAAVGAIGIAWKKLGLAGLLSKAGTAIAGWATKAMASFGSIGPFLTGLWDDIVIGVSLYWKQFVSILTTGWNGFWGLIVKAGGALKAGVVAVAGAIKTAVSSVVSFLIANPIAAIIAAVVALVVLIATKGDEIQKALNKVSDWIKNVFCRDWREIFGDTLGTILNGFVKVVGDILGSVKQVLNGIIDFIRGVFTGDWQRAWNGIKDIFAGVFKGLAAVAKAPINTVISLVNGALVALTKGFNWVKQQLNKLSIKIPDWVPNYGGKTFGFNLSMSTAPKIPMLATGGIVTAPTFAGIGENGREAVLPLEHNTGWMDALADRIAARSGGPTKVVLKVGEKELGEATIKAINQNTKQNGGLQLQLV